jgi:hypothetical protein
MHCIFFKKWAGLHFGRFFLQTHQVALAEIVTFFKSFQIGFPPNAFFTDQGDSHTWSPGLPDFFGSA